MSPFEYVMVLVSIVIGLGLTHILSGIGGAIHRLRGFGPEIRLDAVYLLWVAFVFLYLVSFWWWEFKLDRVEIDWTLGVYLFIIFYAVLLYLLAVVLVPRDMDGVADSWEYFLASRRWFFGLLALIFLVDIPDTFLKGADWGLRPLYVAQVALFFLICAVGAASRRRSVQLLLVVVAHAVNLGYLFAELNLLNLF